MNLLPLLPLENIASLHQGVPRWTSVSFAQRLSPTLPVFFLVPPGPSPVSLVACRPVHRGPPPRVHPHFTCDLLNIVQRMPSVTLPSTLQAPLATAQPPSVTAEYDEPIFFLFFVSFLNQGAPFSTMLPGFFLRCASSKVIGRLGKNTNVPVSCSGGGSCEPSNGGLRSGVDWMETGTLVSSVFCWESALFVILCCHMCCAEERLFWNAGQGTDGGWRPQTAVGRRPTAVGSSVTVLGGQSTWKGVK